jgi:hypothetical protein
MNAADGAQREADTPPSSGLGRALKYPGHLADAKESAPDSFESRDAFEQPSPRTAHRQHRCSTESGKWHGGRISRHKRAKALPVVSRARNTRTSFVVHPTFRQPWHAPASNERPLSFTIRAERKAQQRCAHTQRAFRGLRAGCRSTPSRNGITKVTM